ncbi:MAG TPA: hypothetical protein VFR13_04355 [Jiangellaceae bacterium]|nr:hypothetical protein [Jiangellaceae bacterium]
MVEPLVLALVVFAGAYGVLALGAAVVGRNPREYIVIASAGLEILVVVQVLIAVVRLIGGDRPAELGTFIGYLVVAVVLVPIGTLWALAERSRWAPAVLAVACFALLVVAVRLDDLWSTVGG